MRDKDLRLEYQKHHIPKETKINPNSGFPVRILVFLCGRWDFIPTDLSYADRYWYKYSSGVCKTCERIAKEI